MTESNRPESGRRRWSFPLARVAGIQIRVHITFFLLVPLFAWAGAQAGGPGALGALVWLVVIFGCVVLHELGHCFVARRRGVSVHEIDLLPIGGVSRLEQLPERGRDEFAIAIAGPAVSAAIAAACALIAVAASIPFTPVDSFGGPIVPRLVWFNVLIGVFNLLPAFPLDGGRVFRSLLERSRSLEDATRLATRVGHRLAIAMGVIGLVVSPLLVVIAVFIYLGASAEESATIIHVRLEHRTVGDVMARGPRAITSAEHLAPIGVVEVGDDLEAALPRLVAAPTGALAVTDGEHVVGLLRERDVERLVSGPDRSEDPSDATQTPPLGSGVPSRASRAGSRRSSSQSSRPSGSRPQSAGW
jgi:stage IV sporulation protein FB